MVQNYITVFTINITLKKWKQSDIGGGSCFAKYIFLFAKYTVNYKIDCVSDSVNFVWRLLCTFIPDSARAFSATVSLDLSDLRRVCRCKSTGARMGVSYARCHDFERRGRMHAAASFGFGHTAHTTTVVL